MWKDVVSFHKEQQLVFITGWLWLPVCMPYVWGSLGEEMFPDVQTESLACDLGLWPLIASPVTFKKSLTTLLPHPCPCHDGGWSQTTPQPAHGQTKQAQLPSSSSWVGCSRPYPTGQPPQGLAWGLCIPLELETIRVRSTHMWHLQWCVKMDTF